MCLLSFSLSLVRVAPRGAPHAWQGTGNVPVRAKAPRESHLGHSAVFLGIGGREFNCGTGQEDFRAGQSTTFVFGGDANVKRAPINDPQNIPLSAVLTFPVYIRFSDRAREDNWCADAWLCRAASASRSGGIPNPKELHWWKGREGVEIKLVDIPTWLLAVLEAVAVPERLTHPHAVVQAMQRAKQPLWLTRPVQQRALRSVHALLTALERNGHLGAARHAWATIWKPPVRMWRCFRLDRRERRLKSGCCGPWITWRASTRCFSSFGSRRSRPPR